MTPIATYPVKNFSTNCTSNTFKFVYKPVGGSSIILQILMYILKITMGQKRVYSKLTTASGPVEPEWW